MSAAPAFVTDAQGVNVTIKVKIRASRTRITGVRDGTLEIALAAPPVDGAANEELIGFLADQTGLPKSRVTLVRGERGRTKVVRFHGADATHIERALAGTPTHTGKSIRSNRMEVTPKK